MLMFAATVYRGNRSNGFFSTPLHELKPAAVAGGCLPEKDIILFDRIAGLWLPVAILCASLLMSEHALAQRADENAVAEADDAFGTVVGDEEIGLYTASSARGFSPIEAGNLRINGLYFDQGSIYATPNTRIQRGSSIHVGISAQGYPLSAPTGVVVYNLRPPGGEFITSVKADHGALLSYSRYTAEIDTQFPVIAGKLNLGMGGGIKHNNAHTNAIKNNRYSGGIIALWNPSENLSFIPFWSFERSDSYGGDRPKIVIGDNDTPRFRPKDVLGPEWITFGVRHYTYGGVSELKLPNQWNLKAGLFHSESHNPELRGAFLLNTDENGTGDYLVQALPSRITKTTSGEIRLAKTFREGERRHTFYLSTRARDRSATSGGVVTMGFGPATIGELPYPVEPDFQTTEPNLTETDQITGALAYNGIWRNVGQVGLALQKTDYQRTVTRTGAMPVESQQSPWLYNATASAFLGDRLTAYAGYTRGLEEVARAPGNAANRDEAVPAQLTRQIDAGFRYQLRQGLQFVAGVFQIDKPYFGLDGSNVYRQLGDIRHSGVELSLAGSLTENLTAVAGAVFLRPKITSTGAGGNTTKLTAVGPEPRLIRVNLQYRLPSVPGLALETEVESVSGRYITVSNSHRIGGAITVDAGIRYTTTIAETPVRLRLRAFNLTNTFSVTPSVSGQVTPYDGRRVELSVAADF